MRTIFLLLIPIASFAQQTAGLWLATLQADKVSLRLVLHIASTPQGLAGTLDILDQGSVGLPLNRLTEDGGSVRFTLDRVGAGFEGTLHENEIRGDWKQARTSFPLVFKRTDRLPDIARPQDPPKPYPYFEQDASFRNERAGILFTGTLTLPRAAGPHPAVLLIGSPGPHDRNAALFGHKPFLIISDYLTRRGIAVLRVDGRGAGGTGGIPNQGVLSDFVGDARAAIGFLKSRGEIDPARIGLIGEHQGGLVAVEAAARFGGISFVVLMATPAVSADHLLESQAEVLLNGMHMPPEILSANRALQRLAFDILARENSGVEAFRKIHESAAAIPRADAVLPLLETQLNAANMPWFRELLVYNPRPALAKVQAPVLALQGARDLEIAPEPNLDSLAEALKSGGNSDYRVLLLPGLNHRFQTAATGDRSEYTKIEETVAPSALEAMAGWIASHTRPQTGASR